jgi:hypothetical protein
MPSKSASLRMPSSPPGGQRLISASPAATGETALAALRLRQYGVDFIHQRIALDLELDRGKTQHRAERDGNAGHHQKCCQHGKAF